jgi:hypothetical protein
VWEEGGYATVTLVLGAVGLGTACAIGLFVTEQRASIYSSEGDSLVRSGGEEHPDFWITQA